MLFPSRSQYQPATRGHNAAQFRSGSSKVVSPSVATTCADEDAGQIATRSPTRDSAIDVVNDSASVRANVANARLHAAP